MVNTDKSSPRNHLIPLLESGISALSPLKNSHVAIIGGGGFLGIWLSEAISILNDLHSFNTKVTLYTRTGKFLRECAPHIIDRKDFQLSIQDSRHTKLTPNTEYIVYAVSPLNPHLHQAQPIHTASLISEGTKSFLENSILLPGIKNILFLSSGAVYGSQNFEVERLSEDMFSKIDPSVLSNSFAEAKRFAESLCVSYRNEARLPLVIARAFAFLGPYQPPSIPWALHNFINDAMNGRPIRVFGDGQSVRSYLYGADAALWSLTMLAQGKSGSVYNIGSPESVKLIEAAEAVAKYFNNKVDIVIQAQAAHLRKTRFVPDVSKIERDLKVKVATNFNESLTHTLDWIIQNRGKFT